MIKIYLIWIKAEEDLWLEGSWTDDQIHSDPLGWKSMITEGHRIAAESGGELRLQIANIPHVNELFAVPEVDSA